MILLNDFIKEEKYFRSEIRRAIDKSLKSGRYILGKNVEIFEDDFAKYIGTKYCIGVANGLEALQISMMAYGIGRGDEVITVSNSAVATAIAITNIGAEPVFVDIDDYYHIDVNSIEEKITKKTKAIIPVHLFGQITDMVSVKKIAKKYNLKIIEDACQAHGAVYRNKKAGSFGDTGCFSFYPTKNLGAYGDGGAITTNSKSVYMLCKKIRNYGQKNRYDHEIKGINSRLDELHAAMLRVKLKKLNNLVEKRNSFARIYLDKLKNIKEIGLPKIRKNSTHSFHLFVISAERRDKLMGFLKTNGIESQIHYPIPIHKQKCYKEFNNISLPKTEEESKKMLSIPIHPFLTKNDAGYLCKKIKEFYV